MDDKNYWLQLQKTDMTTGITPSLSRQINLLGTLLGGIVAVNASPETLKFVEALRTQCKYAEQQNDVLLLRTLSKTLAKLPLDNITWLLRVYTLFFLLVNQAEVQEMIRINQQRELQATANAPRKQSVMAAILALKNSGYSYQQTLALLERCDIGFTLTAHPTEAQRQTVLHKQQHVGDILQQLNQPLSEQEQGELISELKIQITLLLYTDSIRSKKVSVTDEVRNGVYYLTHAIWDAVPKLYRDINYALNLYYQQAPESLPIIFQYRSWIGADFDGNPNISVATVQETMVRHEKSVLTQYFTVLAQVEFELSISDQKINISPALCRSVKQDQKLLKLDLTKASAPIHEIYRLKINAIRLKLAAKLAVLNNEANSLQKKVATEYKAQTFLADLELLQHSLKASGLVLVAQSKLLENLVLQAKTFGFHLATLDIRQHSGVHKIALTEILKKMRITSNYEVLPEAEKITVLQDVLSRKKLALPKQIRLSPKTQELLSIFDVINTALNQAIGSYIISMTHDLSDILAIVLLARLTGVITMAKGYQSKIDIIPLFETIADLKRIDSLLTAMFTDPIYQQQLKARKQFQEILLGYSDSNKDGGYWAANYLLHQAQLQTAKICRQNNIDFRLFHGRGGSTGRGGGRVYDAISAMPSQCQNGRTRMTEQGEVISFHYQNVHMAKRHYEQTLYAMLIASAETLPKTRQWTELDKTILDPLEYLTENSIKTYRQLIEHPDFWQWYIHITPIEFISKLPIASRPVSRKAASEVHFDDLRAIPWVFAWTQTRINVPGWFGVGHALHQLIEMKRNVYTSPPSRCELGSASSEFRSSQRGLSEHEADPSSHLEGQWVLTQLRDLYQHWDFFKLMINNMQQEMVKAHFLIAQFYEALATNTTLFNLVQQDFAFAKEAILAITQEEELLSSNAVLKKSIQLRNPYTDALNLLQIELMRRFKQQENKEELELPLLLSVNGLASAMQSTG